ncbi:hypothetical protein AWV80_27730 [Cupriavidus sp. UYMU48A]|nr:hypothetical protein AWV80_27730 [Cupriavidus sp. UYMU48A]
MPAAAREPPHAADSFPGSDWRDAACLPPCDPALVSASAVAADKRRACEIRDAAARWGFIHMGKFAIEYRNMFGYLPSQTTRAAAN